MIVLITGVTGGLGGVLAKTLISKGATVYGTSRNAARQQPGYDFPLLTLDVMDQASADSCIAEVVQREGRIDVLVNCVNEMFIGGVEEATVEEVKHLYDTNVFGVMRLCKAVAPAMRHNGGGTIVNMSSLGGLLAVPYMSSYTSSKFALEAFSEALRAELRPSHIDVVIMQPVAMHMDRPATGHHLRTVDGAGPDSISQRMLRRMAKDTASSKLTPEMVSEKIYDVITAKKKPLRVPMDKAKALTMLKRLAPQSVLDKLVGGLVGSAGS